MLIKCLVCLMALWVAAEANAAPALAMSTAQEVAQGRIESARIDAESLKVDDPFLVSWVNMIGGQLTQYRQRRDIEYHFTVLANPDINAFALKGGFIHLDLGLLNFVSSDDELASTLGHEMGHVELRHVVKSSNQGTIIGILTALASVLSPVVAVLGEIGGELASDKFSRIDELQADKYGLQLMTRAGYDPHAAVDVMAKLGAMDPGPESKADKAFIDHPVPQDRVSHLLGYPALDRPSVAALTAQAIHDQEEGRFSYASARLKQAAGLQPSAIIDQHRAQLDYALRESGALAAPDSRVLLAFTTSNDPRRVAAAAGLQSAQAAATAAAANAKSTARAGLYELVDLEHQINNLAPQLGALPPAPQITNSAGVTDTMTHLTRDITGTVDLINDVLITAPGLVTPNGDTLREMAGPLDDAAPLTPKYQALLEYYPSMITHLSESNQQLLSSIQLGRDAIGQAMKAVQTSTSSLAPHEPESKERSERSSFPPRRDLSPAIAAWDAALAEAQHASDQMYAAQTTGLSAEITMQDVPSSPERYAAFRQALMHRFPGQNPPSYAQASVLGIPPGEIACASWLAFDTQTQVRDVLSTLENSTQSCEDMALSRHLMGESMEIAEGLVYEDYVDVPSR